VWRKIELVESCSDLWLLQDREVLGKTTHKLGVWRLSKSFLRAALADKKKNS